MKHLIGVEDRTQVALFEAERMLKECNKAILQREHRQNLTREKWIGRKQAIEDLIDLIKKIAKP